LTVTQSPHSQAPAPVTFSTSSAPNSPAAHSKRKSSTGPLHELAPSPKSSHPQQQQPQVVSKPLGIQLALHTRTELYSDPLNKSLRSHSYQSLYPETLYYPPAAATPHTHLTRHRYRKQRVRLQMHAPRH
jgi:hypothetical protein